MPPLTRKK